MKLRLKLLLILASIWALISVSIFIYSKHTLMNNYLKLERHETIDSIQQTNKTLNNILYAIKLLNVDWSQWDDAYHFMKNKNANFIQSNMAFTSFENAKINLILFYSNDGTFFYGENYDLTKKKFIAIPRDFLDLLESQKTYIQDNENGKAGILKTREGYVVLSAQPILTSQGKGPKAGTLIMGYFLTDKQIGKLAEIVNTDVHFFPLPIANNNDPFLKQASTSLKQGEPYFIIPANNKIIYGYTLVNDIDKNPIGILRITKPRMLFNQGITTIHSYLVIIVFIGLIFILAMWYLVKTFIVDRIITISDKIIEINTKSDFSERIKVGGNDELNKMGAAFNSLMEIIELTQEQLKYRIFLRTEELSHLSQLNKNLFKEVGMQREIELKLRAEEKNLRQMAYYDTLTGLPNRFYYHEIFQKILDKSMRDGTNFAIFFIDADDFKNINDTYGHDIGDKYLIYIAQQLKESIKDSDVVARFAGDEFIICVNNIRGKQLIDKVAEKILETLSIPANIDGYHISSSFSIGISVCPQDGGTIEDLEKHADLAMYYAKKQPGNTFFYYDEMHQDTLTTSS
ncbi:MAG: sensory box/GGDEF family protein [uncultured bacterium]|nr:MAG: sensory box/GGDEF family protein [uncultured bacterium]